MRKSHLTVLVLTAGAAALAYALTQTRIRLDAAEGEVLDLYWEGQDEHQRAELLRDELAVAHKQVHALDAEWRDTLGRLSRARSEVARLHDTNRKLLDGFAADAARRAKRQQAGGFWVWTAPRCSPSGPFDDLSAARDEAEALARLYAGQEVFVLAAANRVLTASVTRTPVWEVEDSPLELEGA